MEAKIILARESVTAMRWFSHNCFEANPTKFQSIIFGNIEELDESIVVQDKTLPTSESVKLLGVTFDKRLLFEQHISDLCRKASTQIKVLMRFKRILDIPSKLAILKTYILSHFKYCQLIYHFCSCHNSQKMVKVLERGSRFVFSDYISP